LAVREATIKNQKRKKTQKKKQNHHKLPHNDKHPTRADAQAIKKSTRPSKPLIIMSRDRGW
jgi:hypothetical protein